MAETREFRAELKQLMDIIVHSLYSHKEIFLRELISNAADAIGKVRFDSLTRSELAEDDTDWRIRIVPDKNAGTLTVSDNGIGMSRESIVEDLGTIARSGTKEFLQRLQQAKEENRPDLIGQFGVGFYSSFMVAETVTVISRPAGGGTAGVKWTSDGQGTYTVEEIEKEGRGTDVILHLKEEDKEYLEPQRLKDIVRRFSDFVEFPVILVAPKEAKEGEEKPAAGEMQEEILNNRQAIWLHPKSEVTEAEYAEFYKHIAHDFDEPLKTIHYKAEGTMEFRAILFIPKRKPWDLYLRERSRGLQLYVNRVFITDDCDKLLPPYLDFIRGVVDSSDLPLNVSREMLQEDRQLQKIRKVLVNKVLAELKELHEKEYEQYVEFWNQFGIMLKAGVSQEFDHRDKLSELFLFQSSRGEEDQYVTLDQYLEGMQPDQDAVYYMIAENREMVLNSPYMETFRENAWEVLVMTDPVDELVVQTLSAYKEKPLKAIDRGELDEEKRKELGEKEEAFKGLLEYMKEHIEEVKEVKLSTRLKDSPACLVGEEGAIGAQMQRLLKEMGADAPKLERTLEINPEHPAILALQKMQASGAGNGRLEDYCRLLYEGAVVASGQKLQDPAGMVRRLGDLLARDAAGEE